MTPDAGAVRGAAGDAALEEKLDLVGRPTSSDDLLEEDAACERAVEDLGEGKLRPAGWRGRRSAISFSGRSSIQPGDVQRLHAPRHDLETLPVGGHLLRGGAIPWQPVPQHLFGILVGGGEVSPPGPPAAALAGEVQQPCGRKGSGPRDSRRATSLGPSSFSPETSFASRSGPRPRRRPAASESACGRGRATAAGTPPAPRRAAGPARRTSAERRIARIASGRASSGARMVRERVERQDERRLRCHLVTRRLRGVSLANTTNRD